MDPQRTPEPEPDSPYVIGSLMGLEILGLALVLGAVLRPLIVQLV